VERDGFELSVPVISVWNGGLFSLCKDFLRGAVGLTGRGETGWSAAAIPVSSPARTEIGENPPLWRRTNGTEGSNLSASQS
jgi:hypothetical protein